MDNIAITDNILACAQFKPQNDPTENIIRPFYYTMARGAPDAPWNTSFYSFRTK